jgi:hypothetical protein
VCEGYPRDQISRDNFKDIQRAIGRLVDGLPEVGFTPRLVDSYWSKGAVVMVCQDEPTRDWLAEKIPTITAWDGSRLKVVSMDALPTFKRVAAWFPGPVEDTERNMIIWELPGFSCRDFVAVLVKYDEDGAERRLVVCSAYMPYDSEDLPPSRELENLVGNCENENIQLLVGCEM